LSSKRFTTLAAAGAAVCTMALAGPALAADAGKADIEILVDTTRTMGPAIGQAKIDARRTASELRSLFPDARFAVAEFRDTRDDRFPDRTGYRLQQPMTSDETAFQAALDRLQAEPPRPGESNAWIRPGRAPESYNLAFYQSYSDANVGWRPEARKFVVVIGDSEPYNAQAEGFAGCDHVTYPSEPSTVDPDGLRTTDVLAGMRANQRTLLMILQTQQIPADNPTALDNIKRCYASLAAAGYEGGGSGATEAGGGTTDGGAPVTGGPAGAPVSVVQPIVRLVQNSLSSIQQRTNRARYAPGGVATFTVTFRNPNAYPLRLRTITATLPKGAFRYVLRSSVGATRKNPKRVGRKLTWTINKTVQAKKTMVLRYKVKLPLRAGRYQVATRAVATLPNRAVITTSLRKTTKFAIVARSGR
jgi:hypothetical protein